MISLRCIQHIRILFYISLFNLNFYNPLSSCFVSALRSIVINLPPHSFLPCHHHHYPSSAASTRCHDATSAASTCCVSSCQRSRIALSLSSSKQSRNHQNEEITAVQEQQPSSSPIVYNRSNIPTDKNERWEFFYQILLQHNKNNPNNHHHHSNSGTTSASTTQPPTTTTTDIPAGPEIHQSPLRNWCADQRKSYMKTLGVLDLEYLDDNHVNTNWAAVSAGGRSGSNSSSSSSSSSGQQQQQRKPIRTTTTTTEYMTQERKQKLDRAGFFWGRNLEPPLGISYYNEDKDTIQVVEEEEGEGGGSFEYHRPNNSSSRVNDDEIIFSEEFQAVVRLKYKDWTEWMRYYELLVQFYQRYGHTNVPYSNPKKKNKDGRTSVSAKLGAWAARQRIMHRSGITRGQGVDEHNNYSTWDVKIQMIPERRREKLDALNFDWDWKGDLENNDNSNSNNSNGSTKSTVQKKNIKTVKKFVSWSQRIKQLEDYKSLHGDVNVPKDYDQVEGLANWVKKQKKNKKLSMRSRLQLLEIGLLEIGFD